MSAPPSTPGPRTPAICRGFRCPEIFSRSTRCGHALDGAEAVLIVVPSRSVRSVARQVAEYAAPGVPVAVCAKGIEDGDRAS
jgi:glycerol-3-phosphate dehydrogenase (NAD(P)+)